MRIEYVWTDFKEELDHILRSEACDGRRMRTVSLQVVTQDVYVLETTNDAPSSITFARHLHVLFMLDMNECGTESSKRHWTDMKASVI